MSRSLAQLRMTIALRIPSAIAFPYSVAVTLDKRATARVLRDDVVAVGAFFLFGWGALRLRAP